MKLATAARKMGPKKPYTLSQCVVEARLAEKGLSLRGAYVNTNTKCVLACSNGHEWDANVGNVLKKNGTGCPHCVGMAQITMAEVERRLAPRGIKMISANTKTAKKSEFECSSGHKWSARLGGVITEEYGCPQCRSNRPLTEQEVNDRIADKGFVISGEFVNAGTKVEFSCSNRHKWMAIPDNVLRGRGCPGCAKYGFNPSEPAYFYTVHLLSEGKDYVGFGITRDIDTRFSYHTRAANKKGFDIRLMDLYIFDSGHDARALEDIVKENMAVVDSGIPGFHKEAIKSEDYLDLLKLMDKLKL